MYSSRSDGQLLQRAVELGLRVLAVQDAVLAAVADHARSGWRGQAAPRPPRRAASTAARAIVDCSRGEHHALAGTATSNRGVPPVTNPRERPKMRGGKPHRLATGRDLGSGRPSYPRLRLQGAVALDDLERGVAVDEGPAGQELRKLRDRRAAVVAAARAGGTRGGSASRRRRRAASRAPAPARPSARRGPSPCAAAGTAAARRRRSEWKAVTGPISTSRVRRATVQRSRRVTAQAAWLVWRCAGWASWRPNRSAQARKRSRKPRGSSTSSSSTSIQSAPPPALASSSAFRFSNLPAPARSSSTVSPRKRRVARSPSAPSANRTSVAARRAARATERAIAAAPSGA